MTRIDWRSVLAFVLAATLCAAIVGCKADKPVPPEELFATRTLALNYLNRGQLDEAEAQFKKLIELVPKDPLGYASLGLTYLQQGRYADAEQQLLEARTLDRDNPEVRLLLAKVFAQTRRREEARALLEALRRDDPRNTRTLYALAELDAVDRDSAAAHRSEGRLHEILALDPSNVAARVQLIELIVRTGNPDSAIRHLEEIRRIPPALPSEVQAQLERFSELLRGRRLAEARASFAALREALELTAPYQASLAEVKWTEGPLVGTPLLSFAPTSLIATRGLRDRAILDSVRFADATLESGLPALQGSPAAVAAGDFDGDGSDDLFVASAAGGSRLFRMQGGFATDRSSTVGAALPTDVSVATFADYDNDGWVDLFAIGSQGRAQLLRNTGNGRFEDVSARTGIRPASSVRRALFVDLDHDGDLDLLLAGDAERTVYRNNLNGSFTLATSAFGVGAGAASDAAFGDLDGDGRIDLLLTSATGRDAIYRNGGATRLADATATSGITSARTGATALGDVDNDGELDIFVASRDGAEPTLWRNGGAATFSRDRRADEGLRPLRGLASQVATLVDYDNDGWLDLVVAGTPTSAAGRGVFLFRNAGDGRFIDRSALLPPTLKDATSVVAFDADDDGDQDLLFVTGAGALRLLRNDGGNANMGVRVQLKGLRTGSGKNNVFGIGARLELRTGAIYQTRVATGRSTHFGLGPHLKADVLRLEWPNGVPQTVYFPGTDRDVVENEVLKGSCAFAYTWDGKRFRFVTDVMWRSALGMPLGLMGGQSAFAPAGASQEYLRIPGDALVPRDGRYVLQITEELWETAYTDEIKLIAVDHPDSVDVFVDERFVPPGPVSMRLYHATRRRSPLSARDERGRDVLPALRDQDHVYVAGLTPMQYQGVVEPHDLIMDLGPDAGRPGSYLFLRGWIYPTDASINVALSQQTEIKLAAPSLEVRDARGRWTTVVPSLGFPSGKDKTMVIDLAGKFRTSDHHVRIRTNMQIYWDQAFVATDASTSPVKVTTLDPIAADLHARGFSRMYRKGGRHGPYWYDYDHLSNESPWRPITGAFTRFGDVLPLMRKADDMYVVMAPGDETTVQFDASSARTLPKGWKRDFLLYTDGWIKDSDLNTAHGTTVEPLPFHGISTYPYGPGDAYPTDSAHQRYRREYNTRVVTAARAPRMLPKRRAIEAGRGGHPTQ